MKSVSFVPHSIRVEQHGLEYLRAYSQALTTPWQKDEKRKNPLVQEKVIDKCIAYSGIPYWTLTNCCTDSLMVAIAVSTEPGDKVIVPAYGWHAAANMVKMLGRKVIFADIDDTGNIDLSKLDNSRSPAAIIVIHNFGTITNLKESMPNATIIEDAAPSFYMGEPTAYKPGMASDIVCYSFDFTKSPGTLGSGGGIACNSLDTYNKINTFLNHGKDSEGINAIGSKSYMDNTSAAVLLKEFELFDKHNYRERRRHIADYYMKNLKYENIPGDNLIWERYTMKVSPTYRSTILEELNSNGILAQTMFKELASDFSHMDKQWVSPIIKAPEFANSIIHLPSHQYMTDDQVEHVVNVINRT